MFGMMTSSPSPIPKSRKTIWAPLDQELQLTVALTPRYEETFSSN